MRTGRGEKVPVMRKLPKLDNEAIPEDQGVCIVGSCFNALKLKPSLPSHALSWVDINGHVYVRVNGGFK